ncbi:histidine kinase [Georgenia sp. MJ206]|uniref:sensor histidine kinase n=1 Tax=Georgenia wangjunii TaxID=3117730 RepID=UPI002F26887C
MSTAPADLAPLRPPAPAGALDSRRRRRPVGQPTLRPWSRVWRYLVAAGVGLIMLLVVSVDLIPYDEDPVTEASLRAGALLFLDAALGLVALCLLPLRRRLPLLTAVLTSALSALSASAIGAATIATVSMGTWRRWLWAAAVASVWLLAGAVYEGVVMAGVPARGGSTAMTTASLLLGVAVGGICVATGFYIGARRELIGSLHERAETAEREQALRTEAAREAERTRIAREMHDVLAHRISLVAMHAGALAYRSDLSREETAEAAEIIQDNAHHALGELRQVLGVLRADAHGGRSVEPPQPTLAGLDGLLAETAGTGTPVRLDVARLPGGDGAALGDLPPTASRTAYRIVQEALTNARKHAPGAGVEVRLGGAPGGLLTVEVRNAPAQPGAVRGPDGPHAVTPGAGAGLAGMRERAALVGGVLEHGVEADGSFAVRAWLPWEMEE